MKPHPSPCPQRCFHKHANRDHGIQSVRFLQAARDQSYLPQACYSPPALYWTSVLPRELGRCLALTAQAADLWQFLPDFVVFASPSLLLASFQQDHHPPPDL